MLTKTTVAYLTDKNRKTN